MNEKKKVSSLSQMAIFILEFDASTTIILLYTENDREYDKFIINIII